MNINKLAKLTLLGLVYIYSVKLIDTLCHGIFRPVAVAGTVVGLNLLAGLVQLLFFIVLYRKFVPKDKQSLKIAAWLAIVGSAVGLLPKLLAMGLLFQLQPFFFFIRQGTQISAYCPWLTAVLLLAFSLSFFFDYGFRRDKPLKYAFAAGAAGWSIMAAAQSLVVINYLTDGRLVWLADLFAAGPIVFVISSSVTFLGLSIFYMTFARHRFTSR
jgi:hypothetical protein